MPERRMGSMMTPFWYLTAALIAYGSLYPFRFAAPAGSDDILQILLAGDGHPRSLADILGNIALFAPYGLTGMWASFARNRRYPAVAVILSGAALALLLQVLQAYLPARSPALSDVLWNLVGLGLGIAGARLLSSGGAIALPTHLAKSPEGLTVLGLWLASELLPLVPSLDLYYLKENLEALGASQTQTIDIVRHGTGALLAAAALEAVAGSCTPARAAVLFVAVALGKLLIVQQDMTYGVLIGFVGALPAWASIRRLHPANRRILLVLCLLTTLLVTAAFPLDLDKTAQPSAVRLPFAALLHGSMLDNVRSLAGRLLLYAGTLWQLHLAGANPVLSALAVAVWVGLLETIQLLVPGHTADVTEPIWVLLCAWGLHRLPGTLLGKVPDSPPEPETTRDLRPSYPLVRGNWRITFGRTLSYALGLVLALWLVLRVPDIPYNVRELFHGNGNPFFLLIFALAVLWPGASAAWIGNRLAGGTQSLVFLPTAVAAAALVDLVLLYASVTGESINDIVGSNNVYWFVTHKDIWGVGMRRLFLAIGTPEPIAFVERIIRFVALVGPVWLSLAITFACAERLAQWKTVLAALPWFWLFKAVAFDWSSTDNLNELVARDGALGLGGGVYLYLLLILLCVNSVLLTRAWRERRRVLIACAFTIAALPLAWFLLNAGLEPAVHKYNAVFSSTQFLLGPDRSHALSETELMLRWYVVQLGTVLTWAAGAYTVYPVLGHGLPKREPETCSAPARHRGEFVRPVRRTNTDSAE